MGRQASVRQKNGYWFSEAEGAGRYFGRVDVTSRAEAMARLWATLAGNYGGSDRLVEVGQEADAAACDERTNELARPVGRRRHCGDTPFVRTPTTNAAALT
jgi:hypothetical protein